MHDWASIKSKYRRADLLLGNGASCAVWAGFSYGSLLNASNLGKNDKKLFSELDTVNFEEALERLKIAQFVCKQSGHAIAAKDLASRYTTIQAGLIKTVNSNHVSWLDAKRNGSLVAMATELKNYGRVFTTSYDLLLYWAINQDPKALGDGFGKTGFEDRVSTATTVYFLHGALHLQSNRVATTKLKYQPQQSINQVLTATQKLPLFIAEGTADQKVAAISRSPYLSAVSAKLQTRPASGKLVVFGQALAAQDQHITDAIKKSRVTKIAFAIYKNDQVLMAILKQKFPTCEFFDSSTHPLGSPNLLVP
jgi:Domain of unknown function (DUF4917)